MYAMYLQEEFCTVSHELVIMHTANIEASVNEYLEKITVVAGCVPSKCNKPKPYWCPELSLPRDKKRFWRSLWIDMDKPRDGVNVVFKCYKEVKRTFGRISRHHAQISQS